MTHTCSCSSRVEPKLGTKVNQLAEESCKNCGGKLKFDEIMPVPARIPVLEVTNPMSPDLKWNSVTKKRRSKMSIARSSSGASNAAHSGSNFNKLDEAIADKTEHVPLKKRRRALFSPSPIAFGNGVLHKQIEGENTFTWDFSGIELLAAAASMDYDETENANKEDTIVPEDSPVPESSGSSKLGLNCIKSEEPMNNESVTAAETKQIAAPFKVDRRHWDLNIVMEDWDEPYDDPTAGNSSKNGTDEYIHVEVAHGGSTLEFSNLKTEENESKDNSPDGICCKLPSLEEGSRESKNNYSLNVAAKETSDQANEQVITSNTVVETPNQFVNIDNKDSPKTFDLSRGDIYRSLDVVSSNSDEVKSLSSTSKTGSFIALGGTPIQDDQSVQNDDSKDRDEVVTITDPSRHLEPDELVAKPEDTNLSNEESQRVVIMENSCKSCSSGAQRHNPIDSTINARHDSDIFQDQNGRIDLYDSPSEDGELRASFLYSWEENECIDYESDGRNDKGCDDADFTDGFEGGREMTISGKGDKGNVFKRSLKRHFAKHDSENKGLDGKNESNAGSGTTMETIMEENDHELKRHFSDQSDAVNGKVAHTVEDLSRTLDGNVYIEGRSNLDGSDGKNDRFVRQYNRSQHFVGSYSRPQRDPDHDKYPVRYRPPPTHVSKRGGVDQWKHWSSRKPYNASNHLNDAPGYTRPRNTADDSPDKFNEPGFRNHKPNKNYASKSFQRPPFRRSPPPFDREDSSGVQRRNLSTMRGRGRGRGRGRFSHHSGRDFGEDFEPIRRDFGSNLPKRERSFSPRPNRGADRSLIHSKSRSRSRTRSPGAWNSHKEANMGGSRWNKRYQEFKPRGAFSSKPNFSSDYGRGYTSPPPPPRRRRFSSPEFNGDRDFHVRRSPPVREFRRTPKFDRADSSGRSKFDRPVIRPGKMDVDGKFETGFEDRRRGEKMINRVRRADEDANVREDKKV